VSDCHNLSGFCQTAAESQHAMTNTDDPPKPRRGRLWLWLVGVALLLLLIGGILTVVSMRAAAHQRLANAISAAEGDDPNWRLDNLLAHREPVSDEENSALVVAKAVALLPKNWLDRLGQGTGPPSTAADAYERLSTIGANIRLDDQVSGLLGAELKNHAQALALARTVADFRRGRHEIVIGPAVIDTLLGETQSTRSLARLLQVDAAVRADAGDYDGALDSCRAIIQTARSIGDEPTLISLLVRIAIDAAAVRSTWRVLGQGEPSDAALARLQALILDELAQPLLLTGMNGERAMLNELIRRLESGEVPISAITRTGPAPADGGRDASDLLIPLVTVVFSGQRAIALEWMNEAVAISRRPVSEHRALWAAQDAKIVQARQARLGQLRAMLPLLLMPAMNAASSAFARSQGELAATAVLIAAERHRRKTGKWPTTVKEIDPSILPDPPADPYTGKSFRIEHRDGQLVIYSLGPNGKDEHGEYDLKRFNNGESDDVGARAWDVNLRRRPYTPVVEAKK
jgi:hypothetical protein